MSGIPQFNIPAFDVVVSQLRQKGFTIVSPAELDDPETRAKALQSPDGAPGSGGVNGETWGDFLARDVKLIADQVDGLILMKDWHKSRGARLEAFVGLMTGKVFKELKYGSYYDWMQEKHVEIVVGIREMPDTSVRRVLGENMP
jgi:hypothetical protein